MKTLSLLLCFGLLSPAAFAARSLDEPAELAKAARRVPKKQAAAALEAAGITALCTKAALKAPGLVGLRCRLAVLAGAAARPKPREVEKRVAAAGLAEQAADALVSYEPIRRARGFEEERSAAHAQACRLMLGVWDEVRALPTEGKSAAKLAGIRSAALTRFGREERGLGHAACTCVARSVDLVPPDAESGARGALQAEMTSRACFLDKEAVAAERGGPEAAFSGRAASVAAAASDDAAFRAYAESRAFELKRCTDKHARLGHVKDAASLSKCACRAVKRWRFPGEKGRAEVRFELPLVGKKLETHIDAAGKVTGCGPLVD